LALAKAGFVLAIKPTSVLRPHEETIPDHVRGLAEEMKKEGIQRDPIIIDQDTATVLDGMHRLAAFAALRIDNAVCCSVEYSSKSVSIGRWARVYTMQSGDSASKALGPRGLTRRVTLAEAFDALDNKEAGMAVLTSYEAYLPSGKMGLTPAIDTIKDLDHQSAEDRWERKFVPEDDIDVPLQSERNIVVLLRKLGKDDVVEAGRSGKLFPCKTSMHRIDPRPVAVNFPLAELNGATTASLRRALAGREERLLPPDSMYAGRRYKERLLLLDQV
jgi:ParB-like nuclease domain